MIAEPRFCFNDEARLDHFWKHISEIICSTGGLFFLGDQSYDPMMFKSNQIINDRVMKEFHDMISSGKFYIRLFDPESQIQYTMELRKFFIRKKFIFSKYCYQAELLVEPRSGDHKHGFLISRGISDLFIKIMLFISNRGTDELLDRSQKLIVVQSY